MNPISLSLANIGVRPYIISKDMRKSMHFSRQAMLYVGKEEYEAGEAKNMLKASNI